MNKRKLGSSDLYVSEIGLGCMSLGTDLEQAKTIIDKALHSGINYLDTADLYDQGMNEEMIGKVIDGHRKDIVLATKVGNRFEIGKQGWSWDPSRGHIISSVKDSLRRLKTDYIDLYQLHGGTLDDPIDEVIDAFETLKKEGLIRYYGISSIRPNVIYEYSKRSSIVSVMMQYSLLDRRPEELFPFLKKHDISVVARGPLAKGVLTSGGLDRVSGKGYLDYNKEELKALLSSEDNLHSKAIHYCLANDVVASVVAGASNSRQLEETVNAYSSKKLAPTDITALQAKTKKNVYTAHRIEK